MSGATVSLLSLGASAICFGLIMIGAACQPYTFGFWAWQASGVLVALLSLAALVVRDLRLSR